VRRLWIVAAVLAAALVAIAPGSARLKPALKVTQTAPLRVVGRNFIAHERVRVKLTIGGEATYRKTAIAGSRGGFVLVYRVPVAKCVRIVATAVGNRGSKASVAVPPSCQQ
jgi:hypothetical protein